VRTSVRDRPGHCPHPLPPRHRNPIDRPSRTRRARDGHVPLGDALSLVVLYAGAVTSGRPLCAPQGSLTEAPTPLRHTYASFAIAAGVSLFELARFMGTSAEQIDRTYGHLLPGLDRPDEGRARDVPCRTRRGGRSFRY
jgi:hypothetical protein